MSVRDCKGCIYFAKHYGNRNKLGKQMVSNYLCVKKNGLIRSFPKKCQLKAKKEGT